MESRTAFPHLHMTAATEDGSNLTQDNEFVLTEMYGKMIIGNDAYLPNIKRESRVCYV